MSGGTTTSKEIRVLARFNNLTAARFVAALMVYMHHSTTADGLHSRFWRTFGSNGYVGVSFFFLVSGFVLAASNLEKLGRFSIRGTLSFYWKRVARIVPLCLLMAAPMIVRAWHAGDPSLWPFLTFTQAWWANVNIAMGIYAVAWTLSVEMFFYATFPFIAAGLHSISKPYAGVALVAGGLSISAAGACYFHLHPGVAALPWADPDGPHRWLYRFPPMRFGEFLAGIGIYLMVNRANVKVTKEATGGLLVLFALLLFEMMGRIPVGGAFWIFPYVIPLAGLVWALAQLETQGTSIKARLPILLGEASFAFYLVHQAYMRAIVYYSIKSDYGELTAHIVTLVASCCISVGLFMVIEEPVRTRLVRLAGLLPRRFTPRKEQAGTRG